MRNVISFSKKKKYIKPHLTQVNNSGQVLRRDRENVLDHISIKNFLCSWKEGKDKRDIKRTMNINKNYLKRSDY